MFLPEEEAGAVAATGVRSLEGGPRGAAGAVLELILIVLQAAVLVLELVAVAVAIAEVRPGERGGAEPDFEEAATFVEPGLGAGAGAGVGACSWT